MPDVFTREAGCSLKCLSTSTEGYYFSGWPSTLDQEGNPIQTFRLANCLEQNLDFETAQLEWDPLGTLSHY